MFYGTNNEFSKLKIVVICPPINFEIITAINIIQEKWYKLKKGPDPIRRVQQYEVFKKVLKAECVDILEVIPLSNYSY